MENEFNVGSRVVVSPLLLQTIGCRHPCRMGTVMVITDRVVTVLWDGTRTWKTYDRKFLVCADGRTDLAMALEAMLGPL